jgi:hypothetical protein
MGSETPGNQFAVAGQHLGLTQRQPRRAAEMSMMAYRAAMASNARRGSLDIWYDYLTPEDLADAGGVGLGRCGHRRQSGRCRQGRQFYVRQLRAGEVPWKSREPPLSRCHATRVSTCAIWHVATPAPAMRSRSRPTPARARCWTGRLRTSRSHTQHRTKMTTRRLGRDS